MMMMKQNKFLFLLVVLVLSTQNGCQAGKKYWWMNDPSVFGGSNNNNNAVAPQQQQVQQQQVQQLPAVQNFVEQQQSQVETECPAGTKCVQNYFCNEHAIMVDYRVSLTYAQKHKRGKLPQCFNGNDGEVDVCCSTATPIQQVNPIENQQQSLPQAQLPGINPRITSNIPSGTCPQINTLPRVELCEGKDSNCWSVDQPDVDCPNNALCCFDGCRNSCYFGNRDTGENPPALTTPAPRALLQQAPQQVQQQALQTAQSVQVQVQKTLPKPVPAVPVAIPQRAPVAIPQRQPVAIPQRVPVAIRQPAPWPVMKAQQQKPFNGPTAESKPFVMCPAAMLCIPRVHCDFKGVITKQTLNLTPDLEMLRVPLIPCVNPANLNIDVCCRDPDYVDPWPQNMPMPNMNIKPRAQQQQKQQQQQQPQQQQQNVVINSDRLFILYGLYYCVIYTV
jgi:hypothetical protein